MANYVTNNLKLFTVDEVDAGASVSQDLLIKVAGNNNHIINNYRIFEFGITGAAISSLGLTNFPYSVDASAEYMDSNYTITDVDYYMGHRGNSGTTYIDIQKAAVGTNVYTSLFSSFCEISRPAGHPFEVFFRQSDSSVPSGVIKPAFTTMNLLAGEKLKLCILGSAEMAANLTIKMRVRPT